VDAVKGKAEIIMDGGILRGSDVVKAMALGADAVGIARLYGFGLGAAGEAGVLRVLEIMEDEIRSTLGLLGVTAWSELNPGYLHPGAPLVGDPGYRSAFPLLEEGY
jgi:isopentenyl diphosphate isomerase/L-lactate dehydrogenase-like FMN-dependent dehydrogenase